MLPQGTAQKACTVPEQPVSAYGIVKIRRGTGENGKWLATGRYGQGSVACVVQVWNVETGQEVFRDNMGDFMRFFAFSDDGYLAAFEGFDLAKMWLWEPTALVNEAQTRIGRKNP